MIRLAINYIIRHRHYVLPLSATAVFALALIACRRLLAEVNLKAVHEAIAATSALSIMSAFAATAVSFIMLLGYELSANKYADARLPSKTLILGGFCAFAIGNTVGLSIFSGGAVRYRLYTACGLSASKIIAMTFFSAFSLGLTLPFLTAFLLITQSGRLAELTFFSQPQLVTIGCAIFILYLVGAVHIYKKRVPLTGGGNHWGVSLAGQLIEIPRARLAAGQFLITTLDISSAGLVLFFLLNAHVSPLEFLPIYFAAVAAGIISHVPGGIGVFEAVILAAMGPEIGVAPTAAALVLYRLIYIALPFAIACLILLANEANKLKFNFLDGSGSKLATSILALLVFFSGVILLFSGSTPALKHRLLYLALLVPEGLIETSHLMAGVVGLICLLLAQGLYRKLSGAWFLTIIMLVSGSVFSLLKGFDWEEALFLMSAAGLTYAFRPCFYRKSRLSRLTISPQYLLVIGAVLAASLWLFFFSYKNVGYNNELFWQFSLEGHASRSLRAFVTCVILFMLIVLRWLMRPPFKASGPAPGDLEKAWGIYKSSDQPDGGLAMSGDKCLLFNNDGDAFIMYGRHGASLVALFDPIGSESGFADTIWEFRDLCDRFTLRPVFYQVKDRNLHYYIDIGLTGLKIGEEALVDLAGFRLESGQSKELRHLYNHGLKEGLSMEIYEAGQAPLEILKNISDQWLVNKNVREKGFSLGRFDREYLKYFKVAVLKRNESVVAFVNLLETDRRQEVSFDLMRYSSQAPKSGMGFLITALIIYYKNLGAKNLSLGMAPLSGLKNAETGTPLLFGRAASFIYENAGHFYNFKGLRQFKEKFNPVWRPRYVALPRGGQALAALKDASVLISGGVLGLFAK